MKTPKTSPKTGSAGTLLLSVTLLVISLTASQGADKLPPRVLIIGTKTKSLDSQGIKEQLREILVNKAGNSRSLVEWQEARIGRGSTLMNFYYYPDDRRKRLYFLTKPWTHVILVDTPASLFAPEFHFEGVRVFCKAFSQSKAKVMNLMLCDPSKTQTGLKQFGEIAYRVGKGCDIDVIPAGYAWDKAVKDGISGEQSADFVAALSIYSQVTGKSAEDLFKDDEKKKALAACVWKSLEEEKKRTHFEGPFRGVIKVTKQDKKAVRFMNIGTSSENIWKGSMNRLLKNMKIEAKVSSTPRSRGGFQMSVFPKVKEFLGKDEYDILFARQYYLKPENFKELRDLPGAKNAQFQVYDRHWDMSKNSRKERQGAALFVRNMEYALMRIYYHARQNDLYHIPFHLAVARMSVAHPDAQFTKDGTHWMPWYGYMVANMSFTALTGKSGEMDQKFWEAACKGKPKEAQYMHSAARIGHEVMMQLSSLSAK